VKHGLAVAVLLAALLITLARNVSTDPYVYDEADYMYAATLGFAANSSDSPALPLAAFVRTGLTRGPESNQRQKLSEFIRASNDVAFYRHWHGPLYLYLLIPVARLNLEEQFARMSMLAIPAISLIVIYLGSLWVLPGPNGFLAGFFGGLLFLSSHSVIHSTELGPHHLFALCSLIFLFMLVKFVTTGHRTHWFRAVAATGLAFCTLEVAFVLVLTLAICCGWRSLWRAGLVFAGTVFFIWPAAIYKLSFVKSYAFMAYLAVFRKAPWGNEGFFETWRARITDSPCEWIAIAAALIVYLFVRRSPGKRLGYPILIYSALMILATARVITSAPRYSLLYMPALDVFAALTLVPFLPSMSRRALPIALALMCSVIGIEEYRSGRYSPDLAARAMLSYVREHGLDDQPLLVPQRYLPMVHYYFPRTHLRGYYGSQPDAEEAADRITVLP
jgi:hypothetical protein